MTNKKFLRFAMFIFCLFAVNLSLQAEDTANQDLQEYFKELMLNRYDETKFEKIEERVAGLIEIVGLPLNGHFSSVFVYDQNEGGKTVGKAYFLDSANQRIKEVAWFWSPGSGFDVIATNETFAEAYNIKTNIDFYIPGVDCSQFNNLVINNNEVVVGTFEVLKKENRGTKSGFRTVWFLWKKDQELESASYPSERIWVNDIDDQGNILFANSDGAYISNISSMSNLNEKESLYYPYIEIEEKIKSWIIERNLNSNYKNNFKIVSPIIIIIPEKFIEVSKIRGIASIIFYIKHPRGGEIDRPWTSDPVNHKIEMAFVLDFKKQGQDQLQSLKITSAH